MRVFSFEEHDPGVPGGFIWALQVGLTTDIGLGFLLYPRGTQVLSRFGIGRRGLSGFWRFWGTGFKGDYRISTKGIRIDIMGPFSIDNSKREVHH